MKNFLTTFFYKFVFFVFLFGTFSINAQEDSEILEAYEDYTEASREIVYLHLNKSTYIKGEVIGFTAYVLNKNDKKPSLLTANLYVTIEDKNQNVLKQKLIKVDNGIASNTISIDSAFATGNYTIKAYTNWMRNFDEQNYFIESIKVIDPKTDKYIEEEITENNIDAQFLPESGHLLHGVENNIGVILKDRKGFGIANISGEVVDNNNHILSTFKTNELGIGRFPLNADADINYSININHKNKDFQFNLKQKVKKNGIILSVKQLKSKIFVSIITNKETLQSLKDKRHSLMIHNGENYDIVDIYFSNNTTITQVIETQNTSTGINILTLFNDSDEPIAERLFFNYNGLDILKSQSLYTTQSKDSITLNLNYNTIDPNQFNNLSVSVLPEETKSYNSHHNMISYTYLQPYIRGSIENGKYYFTNITPQKKFDLDNLLITQGWSSYDWNHIFENVNSQNHSFEQGITLNANINSEKHLKDTYVIHHFKNQPPIYIKAAEGEDSFITPTIYPTDKDSIYLSRLVDNKTLQPAKLYLQSFPNKIPSLVSNKYVLKPKIDYKTRTSLTRNRMTFSNLSEVQSLDEVTISTEVSKEKTRTRELSHHSFGTIKVISEQDRLGFENLIEYLRSQRVGVVEDSLGNYIFTTSRNSNGPDSNASPMAVFLDDNRLPQDTSILSSIPFSQIDYIDINRGGLGEGSRGFNGAIKIFTLNKSGFYTPSKKTTQKYKLPLTFSANKKFYVPKYRFYNDDFFKGYGVIDWKPELKIGTDGNVTFKIAKPKVPITLFIEGITNEGSIIFEEKLVQQDGTK